MEQPNTLDQIFSANPGAFMQAQGMLGRQQQDAELGLADQARKLQYDQQADPFRLQQLSLQNQTQQAQLPGIQATSAMTARKNSNEELLNPQMLKEMRSKYSSAELKRHVDDLENVGSLFRQGSTMVFDSPLGAGAKVKDMLKASGHEDMWNPAWDNMPASALEQVLKDTGTRIGDESTKFRTLIGGINAKGEIQKDIAADNNETKLLIAQLRADAVRATQAAKGSSEPKTIEAAMVAAARAAEKASDPDEKTKWLQSANMFKAQLEAVLRLKGLASKDGSVDAAGMAKLPAIQAPGLPALGQAGVAPEGTPQSATEMVTKAFGAYEPEKYEYRKDPATGKLQRKLK